MPRDLSLILATRRPAPKFTAGDRVMSVSAHDTSGAFTIDRIEWTDPHAGRPGFWSVIGTANGCQTIGSEKLYRRVAARVAAPVAETEYRQLFWPHGNSFEGRR